MIGVDNMNASKKLKIVMIFCFIFNVILVPVTVFASNVCDSFQYKIQKRQNSVTESTQLYFYGTIEQEDGTEEYVYQDCTIDITIDRVEQQCEKCGKVLTQQGSGEKWTHSDHE